MLSMISKFGWLTIALAFFFAVTACNGGCASKVISLQGKTGEGKITSADPASRPTEKERLKKAEKAKLDLDKLFQDNPAPGIRLVTEATGTLQVTSGRIVADDPFYLDQEAKPFLRRVPVGCYPLELRMVNLAKWGPRVAAAIIRFSDAKPVRWEVAKVEAGAEPGGDEYWVDSGTGCFADAEAAAAMARAIKEYDSRHSEGDFFEKVLVPLLPENRLWSEYAGNPTRGPNIIMFYSGLGDGAYVSYWGLDESGQPALLVTDFQILGLDCLANLRFIGHIKSKGRIQDQQPPLPEIEALMNAGPEAISFLISQIEEDTTVQERPLDFWPKVRIGDMALLILCDFFTEPDGRRSTAPGISWDEILNNTDRSIPAWKVIDNYLAAKGRAGLRQEVERRLDPFKDRFVWDPKTRCFRIGK